MFLLSYVNGRLTRPAAFVCGIFYLYSYLFTVLCYNAQFTHSACGIFNLYICIVQPYVKAQSTRSAGIACGIFIYTSLSFTVLC